MTGLELFIIVYVYPFAQFVNCWVGKCAPVTFPWG